MKTTRLEAFSDAVIAIIITIMVLDLHVPEEWEKAEILKIVPTLLAYALSFLIVAIYWVNHHHLIHLVQKVDGPTLWANMNLLFWISLKPWITACLAKYYKTPDVVALYGALALVSTISFHFLRVAIARHHRDQEHLVALHQYLARKNYLVQAIYVVSIALAWVNVWLSMALIALPSLMYFLPEPRVENLRKHE